jgi:hypothetical protein
MTFPYVLDAGLDKGKKIANHTHNMNLRQILTRSAMITSERALAHRYGSIFCSSKEDTLTYWLN